MMKEMNGSSYLRNFGSKGKLQDINGICCTLTSAMGTGGGNVPLIEIQKETKGEIEKMRIIELFGGIGACTQALKSLLTEGGKFLEIVDYVEIDKYAVKSYNAINETNFQPQDITKWNKHFDGIDLIMHGSPCQDFSLAGKQAGGDKDSGTRSSLMYETIRIVSDIKPKYVVWENVKNLLSKNHRHNFGAYLTSMEELGYKNYYQVLNAKDYGIPQNRERVFTISIRNDIEKTFEFPKPFELTKKLKDLLEDEVDDKYYLSDKMIDYISANNEKWTGNNNKAIINSTIATTINTGEGHRRCDASNYICDEAPENYDLKQNNESEIKDIAPTQSTFCGSTTSSATVLNAESKSNLRIRKLTPKECWRLMGFSDEAFNKASEFNSNAQLYKQAGNSIVVNVLYEILKNLTKEQ